MANSGGFDAYLSNLTQVGYQNYYTVFSPDYRLYLLENQLNLVKNYLIYMLGETAQWLADREGMLQNQVLLEWTIIDYNQRLAALEAIVFAGNASNASNSSNASNATNSSSASNDTVVIPSSGA